MPYTYQEYPKWLHADGHDSVLVEDAEAELAVLDRWTADPQEASPNALVQQPRKGGWPKGKPRK